AAGVHHARTLGGVRQAGGLLDRQGIDVAAHGDDWGAGIGAAETGHEARLGDAVELEGRGTEPAQLLVQAARRLPLFEPELGVAVDLLAEGHEAAPQIGAEQAVEAGERNHDERLPERGAQRAVKVSLRTVRSSTRFRSTVTPVPGRSRGTAMVPS